MSKGFSRPQPSFGRGQGEVPHLNQLQPVRIHFNKNKQQNGEGPQRRAAVAEKGQGNAYNRHKPYGHPDIYKEMEKQYGGNSIPVNPAEIRALSLGHHDNTHNQRHE